MKTKETTAEYNKQYYARTAEQQKQTSRQWRLDNPEKAREQDLKKKSRNGHYSTWSEEKKAAHRASVRKWRMENPKEYEAAKEKAKLARRDKYRDDVVYREKVKAISRLVMPEAQRIRRTKLKNRVFDHYGRVCACCGETEESYLTIDHVNNDGAQHRRQLKTTGCGADFYLDIVRRGFPNSFEVACFNCNCGRAKTGGICAHKRKRQENAAMLQSNEASTIDVIM